MFEVGLEAPFAMDEHGLHRTERPKRVPIPNRLIRCPPPELRIRGARCSRECRQNIGIHVSNFAKLFERVSRPQISGRLRA